MTVTAFKRSQKSGAGAYTSNLTLGREARTGDPATDPMAKPKALIKPQSIAKNLDIEDGCSAPIVNSTGGYQPVKRGGGRRCEPL
jgi:hypothetical protein